MAEHRTTGHSLFYFQFGRDPRIPHQTNRTEHLRQPLDENPWVERLTKELEEARRRSAGPSTAHV